MEATMRTRLMSIPLLAVVLQAGAAEPAPVAAWEEPRHRLVFDKGAVRIFSTSIPAGDTSLFHMHEHPTLYVLLNGARMRNQDVGKDWVELPPGPAMANGAFVYRDYAAEPQTHRVQNVDDHSFQVIGVVNLGPGDERGPAAETAEVQNRWFTGSRFRLRPGESAMAHRHDYPALVVQVGPGNSAVIERGWQTAEKTVAGTWSVHDAGVEHVLANIGVSELELVEIEMK
jgi:hypothetical protein